MSRKGVKGGLARGALVICALGIAACATCAPHERIPIDTAPRNAMVYVNGEALGTSPLEVDLRSDRDHSVFLKREGYRPELVILRSTPGDQRPRLDPGEVRVRLVPLEKGREVEVEVDRADPDSVPVDPNWQRR